MSAFEGIEIREMTQGEAEEIATWRYEPPFDFYDADADHSDLAELLDPALRGDKYFAARDENGVLIGYFGLVDADGVVGIGVGLRPELTGRGLGQGFLVEGMAFAERRFAPRLFKLSVATFNTRAITVYERAGFVATREFEHETNGGVFSFVEMERRGIAGDTVFRRATTADVNTLAELRRAFTFEDPEPAAELRSAP